MKEERRREPTGDRCTQCSGDIFECTVRGEEWGSDHWYECQACGCACPDCKRPMVYEERDTSSGTEYRSYRCPECRREGHVPQGIAMWKAYEIMNAERKR
jgi:hypothetical protein